MASIPASDGEICPFCGEDVIDFSDSIIASCATCGENFVNDDENLIDLLKASEVECFKKI